MRPKGCTFARKIMLLNQFSVRFQDEDACVAYFREIRTAQGVVCTQCGKTTHRWIKGKNAFQCETCGCRMPLTKGTVIMDKAAKLAKKAKRQSVGKVVHYIKMFVLDNLTAPAIDKIVQEHVGKDTVVVTDGSSSHVNFKDFFKEHVPYTEYDVDKVVKTNLPWVHIVIGRCKNGIAAIHGEVDRQFLQLYLNEFCWKFNRRFFRDSNDPKYDLFDRLVKIAACYTSDIKWRNYAIPTDDEID